MRKTAVVFPGQGSQWVGMGRAFHQASAAARELFALAEEKSGLPITRLCFEGPLEELTQTVNLQPAMAAVDLVCWQALTEAGVEPVVVAGHSLGEYPALVAAGALDPATCLELVALRGRLMEREATAQPGAMAAIMGASPQAVAEICGRVGGIVQPANFNTPVQTVITGDKGSVAEAGKLAKAEGYKVIPLKVSGAWHSPLMAQAGQEMEEAIERVEFQPLARHLVPNTSARPTRDAAEVKRQLKAQLTSSVRWVQSVEAMREMGVEVFIEAGPKRVLAGLIKKTAPQAQVLGFEDPQGLEKILAALQE